MTDAAKLSPEKLPELLRARALQAALDGDLDVRGLGDWPRPWIRPLASP
jgi:hypothetical protein